METRREIREFLISRRARITAEQAGLASYGARRVPGLRREEVAVLAVGAFLDPRAVDAFGDWERVATETVAILRAAAGT